MQRWREARRKRYEAICSSQHRRQRGTAKTIPPVEAPHHVSRLGGGRTAQQALTFKEVGLLQPGSPGASVVEQSCLAVTDAKLLACSYRPQRECGQCAKCARNCLRYCHVGETAVFASRDKRCGGKVPSVDDGREPEFGAGWSSESEDYDFIMQVAFCKCQAS